MLTDEQLEAIEGVAIDMSAPYENAIRAHVPESQDKIAYDKFHVVMHLSEAVDKVRRQENKQLRAAGDERLVGTKYDWLRKWTSGVPTASGTGSDRRRQIGGGLLNNSWAHTSRCMERAGTRTALGAVRAQRERKGGKAHRDRRAAADCRSGYELFSGE